jgi:diguanylate cyclase
MGDCVTVRADRAERERLQALESFAVLDTPAESDFDDLTALAAQFCGTPVALVSLVDADRQWFKSRHGLASCETPRDESFCAQALQSSDVLVIPDTRLDPRVSHYRSVTGDPGFRFYAGAPLITSSGHVLGTLCVADYEPRDLGEAQCRQLRVLAAQVMAQLEIRRQAGVLASVVQKMRETKRMLDGVLRHTDMLIYAKDVDGRFVMVNPALQKVTHTTENMLGRTDHDLFDPTIADDYRRNDTRIMATGQRQVFTELVLDEDGSPRTYQSTKFPVYDDAGNIIGVAGVSADVTELEAARAAHEEAEGRLRTLVEQSPVAISVIDRTGALAYANPAAVTLCGTTHLDELTGRHALELIAVEQRDGIAEMIESVFRGEPPTKTGRARLLRDDHREVEVEFTISRIHYAGQPALQAEVRDITADLTAREQLESFANTDSLTGIMNRRAWTSRVSAMAGCSNTLVVAIVDVDRFKAYNDRYGHPAGDDLLQRIAQALQSNVRRSDVVARWGGEEFVVALPDIDEPQALDVLDRLRRAMPAGQTCSIGYSEWLDGDDLPACMARADAALYAAKDGGRDQVVGASAT